MAKGQRFGFDLQKRWDGPDILNLFRSPDPDSGTAASLGSIFNF